MGEVKKTCYDSSGGAVAAEKPRISATLFARKSLLERLDTLTSMDGISLQTKTGETENLTTEVDGPKRSSVTATSYIKRGLNTKNILKSNF